MTRAVLVRWSVALALAVASGALACKSLPPQQPAAPVTPTARPEVTADQKLGWILRLEQQRMMSETPGAQSAKPPISQSPNPPIAESPNSPSLSALVVDRDVIIRRRAIVALGRVGLPEGAPLLAGRLTDEDEYARAAAAFGLGLLGSKGSVAALLPALKDASGLVRGRTAEALGLIGDAAAAPAIAEMAGGCGPLIAGIEPDDEQWPKTPEIEACRLSLLALVRLKQFDALARVALDGQGAAVSRWWPVAYALQRIADPRAVPALLGLASGTGTYTRAFALRGVAAAGDRRIAPIAAALVTSATADVRVRVAAARALAQLHDVADLPPLLAVIRDRTAPPNLVLEAVTASSAIGNKQAFDVMLDLWTHPWAAMRAAAIAGAAKVNPAGFLLVVSSLAPDKDWSVRAALAGTLATLPANQVRSALEALCDDSDLRVRGPALEALAHIDAPDLTKRLADALDAPDVVIRATAARLIGEKRLPDGAVRLVAAYARGAQDAAYYARAAALEALAKYDGPDDVAKATIRRGLADPDWAVRVKAADLLHAMGEAAAVATPPAPLRLPPAAFESAALLHPPYSPHAFIDTRLGTIEIELNVIDSPLTTQSFIERARAGFFNGLTVHRLVPNFVIQTGDPRGDGEGGPGYTLRDELSPLPYRRGTVGMALDWRETGGSQFFITVSPQPHLDGKYTVFGQVVKGEEILDQVAQWDVIERVRIWDGISSSSNPRVPKSPNPK